MKHFLRNVLIAAAAVSLAASCSKEDTAGTEVSLPLSYINLDGVWELVEWNGAPLAKGTYAYIELTREHKFTSYSNIETTSNVAVVLTGEYDIDREDNTVGGYYDYMDYKQWSHRYVVSSLSAGSMTWTASGDASEVRIYSRVDSVPDSIVPSDDTPGDGQLPGTGTEDGSAASGSAAKAFLY